MPSGLTRTIKAQALASEDVVVMGDGDEFVIHHRHVDQAPDRIMFCGHWISRGGGLGSLTLRVGEDVEIINDDDKRWWS